MFFKNFVVVTFNFDRFQSSNLLRHQNNCCEVKQEYDELVRQEQEKNSPRKQMGKNKAKEFVPTRTFRRNKNAAHSVSPHRQGGVAHARFESFSSRKQSLHNLAIMPSIDTDGKKLLNARRRNRSHSARPSRTFDSRLASAYMVADEEGSFDKTAVAHKILRNGFLNTIQRRQIHMYQKNIDVFEQAFATIKSTTGISDIGEIVSIFTKLEERNYSLLTFVNIMHAEIAVRFFLFFSTKFDFGAKFWILKRILSKNDQK